MEKVTARTLLKYWVSQLTLLQIIAISWSVGIASYSVVLLTDAILKGNIAQTGILVLSLMCFLKSLQIYTERLVFEAEKVGEQNEVND